MRKNRNHYFNGKIQEKKALKPSKTHQRRKKTQNPQKIQFATSLNWIT